MQIDDRSADLFRLCLSTGQKPWLSGHYERPLPAGYIETLESGVNVIADPSLHEYYDKLRLIVAGSLSSSERIETIVKMNARAYDHFLREYIEAQQIGAP